MFKVDDLVRHKHGQLYVVIEVLRAHLRVRNIRTDDVLIRCDSRFRLIGHNYKERKDV